MLEVVCWVRKNVYSAYLNSNVEATRQAVYDKLKNVELKTSQELVRHIGSESELMVRDMKATQPLLLAEFRTKFLDEHCIEATEKRLKILRNTQAGALPDQS